MTLTTGAYHKRGEWPAIGPGDGYNVPGGVVHGAAGITEVVAVDSFHPVRVDYR